MIPQMHQDFINSTVQMLQRDSRIEGVALGGSYIYKDMDEYSDLDFVIVVNPDSYDQVMGERKIIAASLGLLLSSFTGEHVGEPRLLICLYGPELLHVDLKFVSLADVQNRVEDPAILWERDHKVSERLKLEAYKFPYPDLQWIEDRFWVWVHYTAAKLGRKELFETVSAITVFRNMIIGPLTLIKNNKLPRAVRKLEFDAAGDLPRLIKTIPAYEFNSCVAALMETIELYIELRKQLAGADVIMHSEAERLSIAYLEAVIKKEEE